MEKNKNSLLFEVDKYLSEIETEKANVISRTIPELEEFAKKNKISIAQESDGIQSIVKNTPQGTIKITGYIGGNNKVVYKYSLTNGPTINLDTFKLDDVSYEKPGAALKKAEKLIEKWIGFIDDNVNKFKLK